MIIRSRTTSEQVHTAEYPAVRESIVAWERRVEAAQAAGRAAGMAESQARVTAAESAATAASKRASECEVQMRADYELRLGHAIAALAAGSAHLDVLGGQLVREAEADIARLALLIAARLLRREVEDDPTWMEGVLADALNRVPDKRGVAVRMHPLDAEVASERKRFILEQAPGIERVEFFGDDSLPRGACIIASQGTRLDASLPTSWERLFRDILNDPSEPLAVRVDTVSPAADSLS